MEKIKALSGVLLIFFLFSCQDEDANNNQQLELSNSNNNTSQIRRTFVEISPQQAQGLISGSSELIIIDVSDNYEEAHLWNAKSYSYSGGDLTSSLNNFDKTKPYIVYGQDDTSSVIVAQIMVDSGFNEIYRLAGDLNSWIYSGLPIAGGVDRDHYIFYDLEPQEVLKLINEVPELSIIDFSNHFESGHLPQAVNYPYSDTNLIDSLADLNENLHYLVYAHHDSVSIPAANLLVSQGFTRVYRLKGNFSAWLNEGLEIEIETNPH